MIGLIGRNATLVSLAVCVAGMFLVPFAIRTGRRQLLPVAVATVYTNFLLITISTAAMVYALITHDFSVSYVAQVGSRNTPLLFTIISLWGALEGSILFWAWVLAFYGAAIVWLNRKEPGDLVPYAAATLLAVSLFFAILLVGPADPFKAVFPVPLDGPGPNPLLQNHILMAVHPPLLYLGYVGLTIPFAFAVGAMMTGEVERDDWIRITRRWTLAAWAFLGAAIIAGAWWSYEVLGWGGYWAWDPVENASLMPFLTATAYLHSVMLQERRGMLRLWNLNLVVGTFVLTILGTFLTRSGIISSVHAFTTGTIGYYFLAFIGVVLVTALVLVAGNSSKLRSNSQLDAVASRDTVFLLNNLVLTAFMFTVLIGTLFPLIAEAFRGVKVSVGEPFFNKMSLPLLVLLLFLMGVGPALPWKRASNELMKQKLLPPVIGAVIVGALGIIAGTRDIYAILAFTFVGYAIAANLREYWIGMSARRAAHGEALPVALWRLVASNHRRYGGYCAHLGVFLVALGITASSTFRSEKEQTLEPGQTMTVSGKTIRLKEVWGKDEPHRAVVGATVEIMDGEKVVGRLQPRMNYYPTSDQPIPTPDVKSSIAGDVYLNLQSFRSDGSAATIRMIVEPLVPWIWFGGGVMVFGSIIAMLPQRRRRENT